VVMNRWSRAVNLSYVCTLMVKPCLSILIYVTVSYLIL
jgi:hypothetical protein